MLVYNYELFKMHENECIMNMFTRFSNFISDLKPLEKIYTNNELVRNILKHLDQLVHCNILKKKIVKTQVIDLIKRIFRYSSMVKSLQKKVNTSFPIFFILNCYIT